MQHIFNKDLTRFMQSLSRERQNRASKRKALLAGCDLHKISFHFPEAESNFLAIFGNLIDASKKAVWRLALEREIPQNYENRSTNKPLYSHHLRLLRRLYQIRRPKKRIAMNEQVAFPKQ